MAQRSKTLDELDSTKQCGSCGTVKLIVEFHKDRTRPDGRSWACKECMKEKSRRRYQKDPGYSKRWRKQNPEARKIIDRRYQENNKERRKQKDKRYREQNKEKIKEYERQYRTQNRERMATRDLAKYRENPTPILAKNRGRKALRRNAEGVHTATDIETIYDNQSGNCAYCSAALRGVYDVDHVIPLAVGGSNWPDNLCCACKPCNRRKGCMTGEEFCRFLSG